MQINRLDVSAGVASFPATSAAAGGNAAPPIAAQTQPPVQPIGKIDNAQLKESVDTANKAMESLSRNLEFSIDDTTGRNVVKVVDASTNQLIRQIPSEEMLTIIKALDQVQGLLIKDKV
jgi:flagellar protein FlaG